MSRQEFEIQLDGGGEGGAWTLLIVPFNVAQIFGSRGRVAVTGTINKQYVDWIEGAKQPDTRARRVEKVLAMLAEGKKLNS